ncbi:efflux RND transporter periplasmic adaptor subunit [Chroococcidiopsis thermalis]|uniref:Efflux transporter, RND family, MFP subunit n=1 Tax=Chroococcidiopsis thermalis (strain PCC 7203) TaxID=251229 RepID=K9U071_CHRTP|nr:efflux RND transporter periplasmic adaptor subunit [Chroococcidiopsis thermalis]AFY87644.1 efflux transporter, RND family, MFP subunit [Chroococcidiopsis thermalis PCC 7203]
MSYSDSKRTEPENQTIKQEDDTLSRSGNVVSVEKTGEVQDNSPPERVRTKSSSRQKRQWLSIIGAIAILLGGGFLGWQWWQRQEQGQSPPGQSQPRAVPVNTATVTSGTIIESSEFIANLESRQSVTLLPQVQGRVAQIYVQPGTQVKAGQPLVQIDPDEQQASVSGAVAAAAAARAQVATAQATLRSLRAERQATLSDLRLSQEQYKRYSALAGQGAVSRETRDQYYNQLQTARANLNAIDKQIEAQTSAVAQAQQAVQQAEANTNQARVQLQYFQVNAPFAGTVGAIPVKVGDLVTPSTQLTTVTQNQPLEVNVSIPRERVAQVEIGTPVELLNEQGEQIGTSKVFFISPQVTNDTQSILIKALFANSPTQLRADSFVRARVIWNQRQGILIPTTAVSRVAGQTFVYVVQQTKSPSGQTQLTARQQPVKLGGIQDDRYQVRSGLQPGDRIVTSGLLNLRDGAAIAPVPDAGQGGGGRGSRGAEEQRGRED